MSKTLNKKYLGDGAYIEDHGYEYRIFCERSEGEHEVYLDGDAIDSLFRFLEKTRNIKITVSKDDSNAT